MMFQSIQLNNGKILEGQKIGELVTDIGTILDSEKAVKCGLIDSVGTLSEAIASLYDMINNQK